MKNILKHINLAILSATAFNNAGWKMDADGKIETKDGNPVWLDANGGESVMKGDSIARLNSEAKTLREGKEAAEAKLKTFDGVDPVKAKEAVDKLAQIDQGQLIAAGKVDEVKQQITAQFTAQIAERDKALNDMKSQYDNTVIANVFAGSQFIRENIAVPVDMFEATFKNNFKIEDGKISAYDRSGNRLMSKKNIGDYAEPDEAFSMLVEAHPQRDTILKASGNSGTNNDGKGGNNGRVATMRRSEFEALPANKQSEAAGKMGKGEIQIVDG